LPLHRIESASGSGGLGIVGLSRRTSWHLSSPKPNEATPKSQMPPSGYLDIHPSPTTHPEKPQPNNKHSHGVAENSSPVSRPNNLPYQLHYKIHFLQSKQRFNLQRKESCERSGLTDQNRSIYFSDSNPKIVFESRIFL
jgi:hypothetical protein